MSLLLLLQWLALYAVAQGVISGRITGSGNMPLPGTSVVIENTYMGVSAVADGSFRFTNLKPGSHTLKVSFVGYETTEVLANTDSGVALQIKLQPSSIFTGEVLISATRAGEKTPMAYSDLSREEIQRRNYGQDTPYLLSLTPSFTATSDAGTGVGYTQFRIRGTDMNRINVTLNGIPLNDAESHGTWFVDQPDLGASASDIQIQRGVGTSTNGAAAFGASINLRTLSVSADPYAEVRTSAGTFNTFHNSVAAGTGLLNGRFTLDTRLSKVTSDGFIDRAFSDLKSFYLSGGYYGDNTVIRLMITGGIETTYQAWNGVPSVRLNNDPDGMRLYEEHWLYSAAETAHMLASNSRTYNLYTYENQVDNYQQDLYQLHLTHRFNPYLNATAALHYTAGLGYYEQYRANQRFTTYGLQTPVINGAPVSRTNLVRRKWLDNDFYGGIFSLQYAKGKSDLTYGGGWHQYNGQHYGKIIWMAVAGSTAKDQDWYRNTGNKSDFNNYLKFNHQITPRLSLFADAQVRSIHYSIAGTIDDLSALQLNNSYLFFNPKAGLFYSPNATSDAYFSYAKASREPARSNFTDAGNGELPRHETLHDFELGYKIRGTAYSFEINLYQMFYNDQLVHTGKINNTGKAIMINVDNSFRRGVEFGWGLKPVSWIEWNGNATVSSNKIQNFTEFVDDWDTGGQQVFELGTTQLTFSPRLLANSSILMKVAKGGSLNLVTSYTGSQYIDNSSSPNRMLKAYLVNHLMADYTLGKIGTGEIRIRAAINNLLNTEYESNAWVYSYYLGGERYAMDGYFPQAGRHYRLGLDIRF